MSARAVAPLLVLLFVPGCTDILPGNAGTVGPLDYIRGETYSRWVIEVDAVSGESPSGDTLAFAKGRLGSLVDKPGGIEFRRQGSVPGADTWTQQSMVQAHRDTQDVKSGDGTVVTHLLFVDGRFEEPDVLGVTIGYDLIVIFSERIRNGCAANTFCSNPQRAEEIVVTHEFGHAIGLVNRGIDMVRPHEDANHPRHSSNEESVMYWTAENSNLFELFGVFGSLPDNFDANDRRDVCNAGGKC